MTTDNGLNKTPAYTRRDESRNIAAPTGSTQH